LGNSSPCSQDECAGILKEADATIGNLECVVATGGKEVEKPWVFRANPQALPVLVRHFGVVTLANNHTGDYGPEAFLEQLELLKKHRLKYFGGGRNCAHARTPLILELKGLRSWLPRARPPQRWWPALSSPQQPREVVVSVHQHGLPVNAARLVGERSRCLARRCQDDEDAKQT